jgi:hypothetical protein
MFRTTDLLIPTAEQEIKLYNITVLQNFKQFLKQRTQVFFVPYKSSHERSSHVFKK